MDLKLTFGLAALCAIALATPSLAKTKSTKKASGVFCEQGSQNVSFPASQFKPAVRNRMRIGQKIKVNIAGVGPLNCRIY